MSEPFSFSPIEGAQISFADLSIRVKDGQVTIDRSSVLTAESAESSAQWRYTNAKLTPIQVEAIRRQYATGFDKKTLADAYGVSAANIHSIIKGLTWRHVGGPISD